MCKYTPKIDPAQIVAIDVHTHAETSARAQRDPCSLVFDEAMAKYFKEAGRPTIPQVAQYYRERKMAAVIFTVDSEAEIGIWAPDGPPYHMQEEKVRPVPSTTETYLIPLDAENSSRLRRRSGSDPFEIQFHWGSSRYVRFDIDE